MPQTEMGPQLAKPDLSLALLKDHKDRTQAEKRMLYDEAFKLFMKGWDGEQEPAPATVADRLGMPLKMLELHAERAQWLVLRENVKLQRERAASNARLAALSRVDEVVIRRAESIANKAADHYLSLIDTVWAMPDSPDPRETSIGAPVKSELEEKIFLLNRVTAGFSAMAQGLKAMGLIRSEQEQLANARGTLDLSKLAGLSLTVINQGGPGHKLTLEKPVGALYDIESVADGHEKAPSG